MMDMLLVWDEGYDQHELASAVWAEISERISALDGACRTLVTISRGEGHLAVGGSARSGLVVYCTHDNEVFWQLLGEDRAEADVGVVAGGQAGTYPVRHVTDLAAALAAAKCFTTTGELAEDLNWES